MTKKASKQKLLKNYVNKKERLKKRFELLDELQQFKEVGKPAVSDKNATKSHTDSSVSPFISIVDVYNKSQKSKKFFKPQVDVNELKKALKPTKLVTKSKKDIKDDEIKKDINNFLKNRLKEFKENEIKQKSSNLCFIFLFFLPYHKQLTYTKLLQKD